MIYGVVSDTVLSCRFLITTDRLEDSSKSSVLFATTWRRRSHRQNLPDAHAAAGHRDPCAVCNSTRRCSHIPGYLAPRVSQPPSKNLWSRTYACIHVGMPPVKRGQHSVHPSVDTFDTDVALWRPDVVVCYQVGHRKESRQACIRT